MWCVKKSLVSGHWSGSYPPKGNIYFCTFNNKQKNCKFLAKYKAPDCEMRYNEVALHILNSFCKIFNLKMLKQELLENLPRKFYHELLIHIILIKVTHEH